MKKSLMIPAALLCAAMLAACGTISVRTGNEAPPQNGSAGTAVPEHEPPAQETAAGEKEAETATAAEDAPGLTMTAKDVTRTGMKLVFTQTGGDPGGELFTGAYFRIERYTDGEWSEMPRVFEGEAAWTMEAWGIPLGTTVEYPEKWIYCHGILPNGTYRIAKEIDDFRKTGDFDKRTCYAVFEITDGTPCAAVKVGGVIYENRGEISTYERTCGTPDGRIETSAAADEMPRDNGQSNFGEGFGYQLVSDTQTDVMIGEKWFAFTKEKR